MKWDDLKRYPTCKDMSSGNKHADDFRCIPSLTNTIPELSGRIPTIVYGKFRRLNNNFAMDRLQYMMDRVDHQRSFLTYYDSDDNKIDFWGNPIEVE